ncbi:hypothetical protein D477_008988 [Arthrobacter crystallopoietes BAB-32]|uniref:Lipoprotein LpqB N-terminal domain-containing protein n=1 Tax=Arthrobacter crystallopoietes BAB-32 TaxID=1246476 RepID=N1V383_9MICC|nr:hypothetical protein [Arthrobacter crystallopoietes]EMY34532.1 hypothetical protein D477_008988 [Arthrobacter crystallopoietes BAB-32]
MNDSGTRPRRLLTVILVLIAVLVAAALAVVFTRGEPKLLDAGTPAGIVQRYTAAIIDGDEDAAAEYLTEAARKRCDNLEQPYSDNVRVSLLSTVEREDSADVKVLIVTSSDGGPFGASEYETEEVFDLVKEDGRWLVESAPWQFALCTNKAAAP